MKLQQDIENNQEAIPADTIVLAGAMSKLAAIRATVLSEIKTKVLTQEQLSAWKDFQQKGQTRLQNWINKLNQPET